MKKADVEKKMTAIKEEVEKRYPSVTTEVKLNEWQKGGYHRLYIDLSCKAVVDGEEKEIIEINKNKYIVLRKYGKNLITGVAVKVGDHFDPFGAVDKYRIVWENGKITLLEPWGEKIWRAPNQKKIDQPEAPAKTIDVEKIGSYDDRIVTIKPSAGKFVVEDDGKYIGDYGSDRDDGIYEAAMYLYDRLAEGHIVKVENDEAYDYIIENAAGLRGSLDTDPEARTIKKGGE